MGKEPVGEGSAVPGTGGVEVGGEDGEDFGVPQNLGNRVGVGEAVGGQQGERAERAEFDLNGAGLGFHEQGGQRVAGIVQTDERAEVCQCLQGKCREGQQAVFPGGLVGAACLTRDVG